MVEEGTANTSAYSELLGKVASLQNYVTTLQSFKARNGWFTNWSRKFAYFSAKGSGKSCPFSPDIIERHRPSYERKFLFSLSRIFWILMRSPFSGALGLLDLTPTAQHPPDMNSKKTESLPFLLYLLVEISFLWVWLGNLGNRIIFLERGPCLTGTTFFGSARTRLGWQDEFGGAL